MNVNWVEYKGKKILYSDFKGLNSSEMLNQLRYETDLICQDNREILYLADFTDTTISVEFMKAGNSAGQKTKKFVKRSAIIGVTGLKPMLLNTFNKVTGIEARAFHDIVKAKEYLFQA